ncbi:hypothetical protein P7D17_06305 [Lactococcus petauri]|jgi:hypothetical protein|uniref:Surface protein n=1 Tax=Lactococcus petauri TaxID=1940789 RepID=A0AAJ2IUZ0_9LACT|nr:hypothetical protein [Lactococcus petauri]MDT2583723.1 hypothetical protein [Lactococcus petauri]
MMKDKNYLKIIIALIFSVMICSMKMNGISADSDMLTVRLHSTQSGIPNRGAVYTARNLDGAYQKIMTGDITSNDFLSPEWKQIQSKMLTSTSETTKLDPSIIHLPNGLQIGPGLKHSPQETILILEAVLRAGGIPMLMDINGTTEGIFFHQPEAGKMGNTFTNAQGNSEAVVNKGITAIMSGSGNFQKLVTITEENQQIDLDTDNLDNRLEISVDDRSDTVLTDFKRYIVDSASPITFHLKVSRDFNKFGGDLLLSSSTNLAISSVRALGDAEVGVTKDEGNQAVPNPNYQIALPTLDQDLTLEITASILPLNIDGTTSGNASLSVSGVDDNQVGVSAKSPVLVLSGINFAMTDSKTNKLATGGEYLLGKQIGKNYQLYSAQKGWITVPSLNNIDNSQFTILKGGNKYSIGSLDPVPIPPALNRFNYNSQTNSKLNQSLIQIVGLAKGNEYFLYPIKAIDGHSLDNGLIQFSVFSNFEIGRNKSILSQSSLNTSQNQNFTINTTIPDFLTGVNEYNFLTEKGIKESPDVSKKVIIPIVLFCIVIFVIAVLLIKFM